MSRTMDIIIFIVTLNQLNNLDIIYYLSTINFKFSGLKLSSSFNLILYIPPTPSSPLNNYLCVVFSICIWFILTLV